MKRFSFFVFWVLFLTSCNHGYKFWDISKFNIVDSALKDNEPIKLLYSSRGPDNNKDLTYFIHLIVVSQKTGDTVNILNPIDNGFSRDDKEKVFNYYDQNNIAFKLSIMDSEKIKETENIKNADIHIPLKISRVVRDPKYDDIADNKFSTVIGTIGTSSK